ncbi:MULTISPECIES: hypothetical protein [unclassified Ruegeria]|uniref:hypothetical protein n=1 Tax=unclassified Ruegeria TaxID=2625375 RepID=UPI001492BCFC|nr:MULTISPECIES: hypothetical protein [unclassified Ruegeria]NOD87898.1 hypothetical protein [Ruegeria sp. HKCCD4318]NOE14268.1 hypothetical protein [Ruegeria sp. HKCCD4318-2]NOG08375.1 hypothetical protein [Ruegeria sp. HKCCD4315]
MRQISLTQHRHSTETSVYVDGQTQTATTPDQIGAILAKAGVKHSDQVYWSNPSGKVDRLLAAQFLPPVDVKPKRGKRRG